MFGDDHCWLKLAIWLISVRSVYASSSFPREFTRREYFVVETITARVEEDSVANVRRDGAESSETNGTFAGSFNDTANSNNASTTARILSTTVDNHADKLYRNGAESSEISERFDGVESNETIGRSAGSVNDAKIRYNASLPARIFSAMAESRADNLRRYNAESSETGKHFHGSLHGTKNRRNNSSLPARTLFAMMEEHAGAESGETSGSINSVESSDTGGGIVDFDRARGKNNASLPARTLFAMVEERARDTRRGAAESGESNGTSADTFNDTEKKHDVLFGSDVPSVVERNARRLDGANTSKTSDTFNDAESSEINRSFAGPFNNTEKRKIASIPARTLFAMVEERAKDTRRDGAESSEISDSVDGAESSEINRSFAGPFNNTEKRKIASIPARTLFAMVEERAKDTRRDGAESSETSESFVGLFDVTEKNTYIPLGSGMVAVKESNASKASRLDGVARSKTLDVSFNSTERITSNRTTLLEKDLAVSIDFVAVTESNTVQRSSSQVLVPLCCPVGQRVTLDGCVETNGTYSFPPLYESNSFELIDETPDRGRLAFFVRDPCENHGRYNLDPNLYSDDAFLFLDNGTIYKQVEHYVIEQPEYCFGIVVDSDLYNVILCFDNAEESQSKIFVGFPVGLIVSAPCLFATFLVYTLIPELNNMHGRTLRGYVASLFIAYVNLAIAQIIPDQQNIPNFLCIIFAFVIHFSFLASFFWLNVMCFDIWWTFGGFRSLQGSVKQRERKKFLIYSIYAWGCASIFTGICMVMDFVPSIPENFIRPRFGEESCWFANFQRQFFASRRMKAVDIILVRGIYFIRMEKTQFNRSSRFEDGAILLASNDL
ncbi:uncharacterized protein LOC143147843 isoform X2 [Ptiloglossa arizonensis]|uniref:uncharacterized protein LOC143147843 isoform X2 n=1 Tax=Ptiloglossa arizonensis TaxID=3350558 RepID=UPI003F9FBC8B